LLLIEGSTYYTCKWDPPKGKGKEGTGSGSRRHRENIKDMIDEADLVALERKMITLLEDMCNE